MSDLLPPDDNSWRCPNCGKGKEECDCEEYICPACNCWPCECEADEEDWYP